MHLTRTADYAVRMVVYLAAEGGVRSSKEIGEGTDVSRDYVTQISAPLRRRGVIRSVAGPRGGYEMARPTDRVTLFDLVDAAEPVILDRGLAPGAGDCPVRRAYARVQAVLEEALKGVTVGQLLDDDGAPPGRSIPAEGG